MTEDSGKKIAILDQGSNTLVLLVAKINPDKSYQVIDEKSYFPRLGQAVRETGKLATEAVARSLICLKAAKNYCRDVHQLTEIKIIGTSALRLASNRQQFLDLVEAETGLSIEVISEAKEAEYSFLTAANQLELSAKQKLAAIDIGGLSTEISLSQEGQGQQLEKAVSLPLGAVTTSEKFNFFPPLDKEKRGKVTEYSKKILAQNLDKEKTAVLCGSAGTWVTLASIDQLNKKQRGKSPDNYLLTKDSLQQIIESFYPLSAEEIRERGNIDQNRADVIIAGTEIALATLDFFAVDKIKVKMYGIRLGYLISHYSLLNSKSN